MHRSQRHLDTNYLDTKYLWRAFYCVCIFHVAWLSHQGSLPAAETVPPNIVVILADDLGYGDPRCYNSDSKIETPHIDKLAAEGMRFTDAHSCGSVCVPSRYGLLTGRYPFRAASFEWRKQALIEPGRLTIPQLLQQHGYRTACVGKWHLGFDEGTTPDKHRRLHGGPVDRGFQSFFGLPASLDLPPYFWIRDATCVDLATNRIEKSNTPGWDPSQGAFWRAGAIAPGFQHAEVLPKLTEAAIEQIAHYGKNQRNRRFFLYVALTAPHTPWLPDARFQDRSRAGLYGDFVMHVDHAVGRIMSALEEQAFAKETLVVFTSDNGPVWYRENVQRFGHNSSGTFRGIKGDAWEGGHRVPMIVRWPGRVAENSTASQMTCHADLMATFTAVADIDLPTGAGEDTYSLLPVLTGDAANSPSRRTMITQSGRNVLSIREGAWKLIPVLGSGGFLRATKVAARPGEPSGQLYNLDEDPGETNNRWEQHPEIVERLTTLLKQQTVAMPRTSRK